MKSKTKQILKPGYKQTEIGEIPEEWKVVRLGDEQIAHVFQGKTPRKELYTSKNTGLKIIKFRDIDEDGNIHWGNSTDGFIKDDREAVDGLKEARVSDVYITASAHAPEHIGKKIGFLKKLPSEFKKTYFVGELICCKARGKATPSWVYYWLSSDSGYNLIQEQVREKHLIISKAVNIEVPLPPLPEQRKIAEILSTVAEATQKTNEIIQKTQELKKGLMQQLLTRGISHTKFKQTEIGEIPEEWEVVRLGEITEIIGGGTPSTGDSHYWNGNIPFVIPTDITNLRNNYLERSENYITEEGLKNSSAKLLPVGTVLLTSRATIGFCAINKIPVATNQGFASLICGERVLNSYILYSMRFITNKLESLASGSTFREVSKTTLKSLKLPLPPFLEQRKIAEILSTVDEKIEVERQRKEKLEELKKGLMQVLLTGKVRVTWSLESVESCGG